jgi:hypothetical protein
MQWAGIFRWYGDDDLLLADISDTAKANKSKLQPRSGDWLALCKQRLGVRKIYT